jgi:hypothetical protein
MWQAYEEQVSHSVCYGVICLPHESQIVSDLKVATEMHVDTGSPVLEKCPEPS